MGIIFFFFQYTKNNKSYVNIHILMKKNILLVAKSVKAQILLIYISGSYILLKIKSKLISV